VVPKIATRFFAEAMHGRLISPIRGLRPHRSASRFGRVYPTELVGTSLNRHRYDWLLAPIATDMNRSTRTRCCGSTAAMHVQLRPHERGEHGVFRLRNRGGSRSIAMPSSLE